jgi:TetR/AcrR family transcriptional repressor of nem operon
MARDGSATRTALLDAAQGLMLDQGYSGTPIDDILAVAGVTKGAFFHHFRTKQDLARALIRRYAAADVALLDEHLARAERLHDDPLQQLLVFVGLYLEAVDDLEVPSEGCLMASYVYEAGVFDDDVLVAVEDTVRTWRERLHAKLEEVAGVHPARAEVDLASLADQMTVLFEGSFIVSRTLREAGITAAQLTHWRTYLQLLFEDEPGA